MELTRFVCPTAPFFYKYGRTNTDERMQWLADTIPRHELYLPLPTELNDLREGRPRLLRPTLVEIANQIGIDNSTFRVEQLNEDAELTEEVHAVVAQTVHEALSSYRIYSMSKRWDNLSMWQWYGDEHRGFCLEFQNLEHYRMIRDVVYAEEPVTVDLDTLTKTPDAAMFWWKSHDWSNEEEVRLVVPGERGPKMTFVPHFLKRVILGKDMPADRVAQIRASNPRASDALGPLGSEVGYR